MVAKQKFYRYIKYQVSTEVALENMRTKILTKNIPSYIAIDKFNPDSDATSLAEAYNRTLLAASDPYAPIGLKEITAVGPEGILVVKMFNKIGGFAYLKTRIENTQIIGEIAMVGVIPEKRRQGIATALSLKIAEYFIEREAQLLECEVYEKNSASLAYIQAFGFERKGERLASVDEEDLDEQIMVSRMRKRPKLGF